MSQPDGPVRGRHLALLPDRWADDCEAAVAEGYGFVRTDLAWASTEPTAGRLDGQRIEQLRQAAAMAHERRLGVWLRLLQPTVPTWFDNDGAFTDDRAAARAWPRWVERAAEAVGDVVDGWVPMEAPYAVTVRSAPGDARRQGEVLHRLVVAWRDAWRILRGGPPVATALDVAVVRPAMTDSQPHLDAARREDAMRWFTWLHGLTTGEVAIPGRADVELADLAGACDVLGVACRGQVEAVLHRTAEMGPPRPLALTYRAPAGSDAERAEATARMRDEVAVVAGELPVGLLTELG